MNSASTPATTATIFHNPACSNSRGALQLLRERGIEPLVIDYLATPLTAPELAELVAAEHGNIHRSLDLSPAAVLRLLQRCDALRSQGLRIALDDMGAGFNCLSVLAMVRSDFIKVDRGLVHQARGSRARVNPATPARNSQWAEISKPFGNQMPNST